jgi:excisionase family DNA binding protein
MSTIEPLALSPADAAKFLGISKRSVSNLIIAGKVIARRHGRRTLVETASLREFLASLPRKTEREPLFEQARRARPRRAT